MSFSDLFDSEFKTRNKGHFSAIARVALADGYSSVKEKTFLDKLAANLEISNSEYEEILENPTKYPINPPYSYNERLERLFDLGRMVYIDDELGEGQLQLLEKFGIALGFTPSNVEFIVRKALKLIEKKSDLDTFIYEMKNMYK
ncbi:TerB family tellurite resistance protein [Flavobacterium ammonificans]|jgi:hypothetical protein|uniref:Fructose 1,6-bisphosphatase n=1 Tax=Flavobacterium ammonificans TaxID=1751056 RepID=A0ABM7UX65_9FLAO|nr:TerB family tellurite resistance protein [Flavobacterium ammonificans]BDB51944.1 fructose 1,6-bisphosphatase [Flavobacterium ammonificans]BDB55981.1 fructose 1,6-bisphosphatase [Flavobacterium ammonificans]